MYTYVAVRNVVTVVGSEKETSLVIYFLTTVVLDNTISLKLCVD